MQKQIPSKCCVLSTLHPLLPKRSAFTLPIQMFCPLWLFLRRYPAFSQNFAFVTGVGENHRVIKLGPIYAAFSDKKSAALLAFYALNGAGVIGSFSEKARCFAEELSMKPQMTYKKWHVWAINLNMYQYLTWHIMQLNSLSAHYML